ncbi:MAG: glycosyltransferase family A protein [Candidatus Hermodarchaeota archaeon]
MEKVVTLIPVRNEEHFINAVIKSIVHQTHPIEEIVVVDDGSSDQTASILKELNKIYHKITILSRPNRGYSAVGRPEIAVTFNTGFNYIKKKLKPDYILIIGGDTIIPTNYTESLLNEFSKDRSLAIASGIPRYEYIHQSHVAGSGRMIDVRFLEYCNWQYPILYCWESYCLFKATSLGLNCRSFSDIISDRLRRGGGTINYINYGRGLRELGYHPIAVIFRAIRSVRRFGAKSSIGLISGYFMSPIFKCEPELRSFVWKHRILQALPSFIR